jgi:glycosyltransferase involved in cell wall biosynthesis
VTLERRVSAEEKLRLLQEASVYLQPSEYESFGVAIAEAMACGTPVVSSTVGAVPDVVGDAGVLLPPDATPSGIAEAIIELLAGRTDKIDGARDRIVKHFSYDARKELIEQVLAEVQGSGRRRRRKGQ